MTTHHPFYDSSKPFPSTITITCSSLNECEGIMLTGKKGLRINWWCNNHWTMHCHWWWVITCSRSYVFSKELEHSKWFVIVDQCHYCQCGMMDVTTSFISNPDLCITPRLLIHIISEGPQSFISSSPFPTSHSITLFSMFVVTELPTPTKQI